MRIRKTARARVLIAERTRVAAAAVVEGRPALREATTTESVATTGAARGVEVVSVIAAREQVGVEVEVGTSVSSSTRTRTSTSNNSSSAVTGARTKTKGAWVDGGEPSRKEWQ